MGTGHVHRGIALAQHLNELGVSVVFTSDQTAEFVKSIVSPAGFSFVPYNEIKKSEFNWGPNDLIIFDSYAIDEKEETFWKSQGRRVGVIDDLAQRKHNCDFLIDTNLHASPTVYDSLVPAGCRIFLGPRFALLKPDFFKWRTPYRERRALQQGLMFWGGTDPQSQMRRYVDTLLQDESLWPGMHFHLLSSKPILGMAQTQHPRLHVHIAPSSVAQLMSSCDFYLGSGGTVTWERMCLGLSGVVISVADNQVSGAKNLQQSGLHRYLGNFDQVQPKEALFEIRKLSQNLDLYNQFGRDSWAMVDGSGTREILQFLSLS